MTVREVNLRNFSGQIRKQHMSQKRHSACPTAEKSLKEKFNRGTQ